MANDETVGFFFQKPVISFSACGCKQRLRVLPTTHQSGRLYGQYECSGFLITCPGKLYVDNNWFKILSYWATKIGFFGHFYCALLSCVVHRSQLIRALEEMLTHHQAFFHSNNVYGHDNHLQIKLDG